MSNKKIYPFKFLDAYTQQDKDIFFGREEEVKQLYQMLFQSDLILIYGASGTGKTSLIQCGLANQFNPYDWFPIPIRRKNNLNDSIEEALRNAAGKSDQNETDAAFDSLFEEEESLISPLEQQLKAIYLQHFRPIYLIFDQFEELYVLGKKEEQEQFVQMVKEMMQIEQPIKILLSIREEYLGSLYEFEKAVPELLRKKLRIEPMNLDKVQQVLTGIDENPKTNVSLKGTVAEKVALTDAIFQKIQGEEKGLFIQLPYLQVFLDKLYRHITQDESLEQEAEFSLEAVQEIGDIGNVLRDFLNEQVLRIAQKLKQKDENIWKILSPFATLEGTKAPTSKAMLQEQLENPLQNLIDPVMAALVNARILRYSEKDKLYEVAHDTLAKQIAAKRSDEEIAILEIQTLIKNQLAFGNDLFSERQLNVIMPYLEKLNLDAREKQLIDTSQTAVERQKRQARRRRNTIIIALALVILLLSALSFWAYQQSEIAKEEARKAAESDSLAQINLRTAKRSDSISQFNLKAARVAESISQFNTKRANEEREKAEALRKQAEQALEDLDKAEAQRKLQEEQNTINIILGRIDRLPEARIEDGIKELDSLLRKNYYPNSRQRLAQKLKVLKEKRP